jgi:amino acid transporter
MAHPHGFKQDDNGYDYPSPAPVEAGTGSGHDAPPTKDALSSTDDFAAIDPSSGVKRGLKTRHLSMMALAGIIGPGLLIGSGGALANGGPASLLIGFGVIGIVAFSIMQSLGEMTTLFPSGGAFTALGDRFVDRAFGCALGWNYYIIWFCVLANEYNALASIFVFWSDKVPLWGYFLIFWFAFTGFQLLGVESYVISDSSISYLSCPGVTPPGMY